MTDADKRLADAEDSLNAFQTENVQKKQFDLSTMAIKANDVYPDELGVIMQGQTKIMSVGNVSVIAGLPKSRKSFLTSSLITAFLSGGYMGLTTEAEGNILLIDTEQSRQDVLNGVKRIYRLMNWDYYKEHPQFTSLALREYSPEERRQIMVQAIEEYKPVFVILDGFADIVKDTNSSEESTESVGFLMRLSTIHKCHICSILHTNPGSEKVRGHAGSELQRKAESILLVTKSEEISTVSPQFCRHIEFNRFSFRIKDGLPVACDYTPTPQDSNRVLFETIFMSDSSYKWSELLAQVKQQCGIKDDAAGKRIRNATKANIIYVSRQDKLYHLRYPDEPENEIRESDLEDDLPE